MKLKCVQIQNYRSIKKAEIHFNHNCRILVGINESGKSNILEAISLLAKEHKPSTKDEREPLPDEKLDNIEHEIRFVFDLSNDLELIYKEVLKAIINAPAAKVFTQQKISYTIKQFCETYKEGLYIIYLSEERKVATRYAKNMIGAEISPELKTVTSAWPPHFQCLNENKQPIPIKKGYLIRPKEEWKIPAPYISDATAAHLDDLVGSTVSSYVLANLPSVVYWKYSDSQLLPEKVNLEQFSSNPSSHLPLLHMFALAGCSDVKSEVQKAKAKGEMRLNNLLRRVAESTTEYFRSVWKEYRDVKFSLKMNGDFIQCSISEHNDFAFNQRSDGFKRFIAFLLTVSSQATTGKLKNSLILVDEPDSGLHPSGARYLRNELLKISKDNYVVFSTHSIFMIDKENISRHLIVEKKNEITTTHEADEGNLVNEEVIFGALNYNVHEHLRPLNIITEGWRDKTLMKLAIKHSEHKAFFANIGIVNVEGIKSFKYFIPLLELAERSGVIISDCDQPAKEQQKEYNKLRYKIGWCRYDEISSDTKAKTGEDFLKSDYIISKLKPVLQKNSIKIDINEVHLPDSDKLAYITEQLHKARIEQAEINKIKSELKDALFDNLARTSIDESYYKFLENVKRHVEENLVNVSGMPALKAASEY